MLDPLESIHLPLELSSDSLRQDDNKVVVQAYDCLMIFRWIKIDGEDGLGGAKYYGGFNFVIDGYASDPSTNEVYEHLLATSDNKVLRISDITTALLAGEVQVNLIPVTHVNQLVTGESLRKVRLRRERRLLTPAEEIVLLRTYKHCGSCTKHDCYCIRR